MFHVYVIQNREKGKTYTGHTDCLELRLKRHNGILPNKKTSYTNKNKGEWLLIYEEVFETREEAIKREKELKSFRGREFVKNQIENMRL